MKIAKAVLTAYVCTKCYKGFNLIESRCFPSDL